MRPIQLPQTGLGRAIQYHKGGYMTTPMNHGRSLRFISQLGTHPADCAFDMMHMAFQSIDEAYL